jgi:hypothetical protein
MRGTWTIPTWNCPLMTYAALWEELERVRLEIARLWLELDRLWFEIDRVRLELDRLWFEIDRVRLELDRLLWLWRALLLSAQDSTWLAFRTETPALTATGTSLMSTAATLTRPITDCWHGIRNLRPKHIGSTGSRPNDQMSRYMSEYYIKKKY